MKKNIFILVLLFSFISVMAQNFCVISFQPLFGERKLQLSNAYYQLSSGDSIQFESLKFYISDITFSNKGAFVFKEENSVHLLDASNEKTLHLSVNIPSGLSSDQLNFNIGLDSVINVSGALGSDLDPTKGMYWAWQSGYINFKLEGKSKLCKTRNNEFQFHVGGYLSPFQTIQQVSLKINSTNQINVSIDIEKFITELDLTEINQVMTPGVESVVLSRKLLQLFSVQ